MRLSVTSTEKGSSGRGGKKITMQRQSGNKVDTVQEFKSQPRKTCSSQKLKQTQRYPATKIPMLAVRCYREDVKVFLH